MLFQTLQPYWSKTPRIEVVRHLGIFGNLLRALGTITPKGSAIRFCRGPGLKSAATQKFFCFIHWSRVKPTTMSLGKVCVELVQYLVR